MMMTMCSSISWESHILSPKTIWYSPLLRTKAHALPMETATLCRYSSPNFPLVVPSISKHRDHSVGNCYRKKITSFKQLFHECSMWYTCFSLQEPCVAMQTSSYAKVYVSGIYLFIFKFLFNLFLAVLVLSCRTWAFSSYSEWGPHLRCTGFSLQRLLLLQACRLGS